MSTFASTVFPRTPRALTIQSYTVHGYVGNKASTFPLQCIGFDVDAINTVEISNHPGYANGFTGKMTGVSNVTELLDGIEKNNLVDYDVVLSGYTRSLEVLGQIEAAVRRVKAARPDAKYVCDPVLGDNGKYVQRRYCILHITCLLCI
jgi:pyridoxine kinase